jgi:hypothetical protein
MEMLDDFSEGSVQKLFGCGLNFVVTCVGANVSSSSHNCGGIEEKEEKKSQRDFSLP